MGIPTLNFKSTEFSNITLHRLVYQNIDSIFPISIKISTFIFLTISSWFRSIKKSFCGLAVEPDFLSSSIEISFAHLYHHI